MRPLSLALLWLMILLCSNAQAEQAVMSATYPPVLQRFTDEDGLPLNSLTAVLQAQDGYLWVASVGGLARFDGTRFTPLPSLTRRPVLTGTATEVSHLPSIRILDLAEDDHGRIWIATQDSGISLYDHGKLLQLDTCDGICQVNQFVLTDGHVYAATDAGLFKIHLKTLQSESLLDGDDVNVTSMAFDRDGLAFMLVNGALATLEDREPWLHAMPPDLVMPRRLHADAHGIYITAVSGLHHVAYATGEWTWHNLGPVQGFYRSNDGRLLVSTVEGEIWQRQDDIEAWTLLANIAPSSPNHLAQDGENNLWIGTQSSGLIRLRHAWIATLADPDPAFDMKYPGRSIAPDGKGGVWLALACAHVRHWHADGVLERPQDDETIQQPCVETLHLGRKGNLWMGDIQGRLQRLAPDGKVETLLQWPGHQPVRAIHQLPDDSLLVSVRRSTLRVILTGDGKLARPAQPIPALEGMIVRQIVPSYRQGVWFVGESGAVRLHEDRIVERWGPDEGLSGNFARALLEDSDGTLWIGTYGAGLNRIANGKITTYHQDNGLYDNTVSCILKDSQGRLWLAGNRGITLIDPKTATQTDIQSRGFAGHDGLIPAQTVGENQGSCIADDNGRFWFALVEGFAFLDPESYKAPDLSPPPVRIEQITVAGIPHDPNQPLHLDARAQNIEIDYSAVALTTPKRLRFRFRMEGMDLDWIDAGTTRRVVYPSLPWGDYTFQVQAHIDGTPWPEHWAEVDIHRPTPWYQRIWVWLACTLLALVLLLDTSWQRAGEEKAEPEDKGNL